MQHRLNAESILRAQWSSNHGEKAAPVPTKTWTIDAPSNTVRGDSLSRNK
jgi:hypothetical protein